MSPEGTPVDPAAASMSVDLNADLGEGVTDDEGLLAVVTSANVACGYHAGDDEVMATVCRAAVRRGVVIGAQVSYADRAGFGRRELEVDFATLRDQVADQVAVLRRHAREAGGAVAYLKPHGALYHRVARDEEQARAVLAGSGDLPVLGLPGSLLLELARRTGRRAVHEGFPDRGYTDEGGVVGLVPRDQPGALVEDPDDIAANAVRLAREVDSVCVHGDSPGAVEAATRVRQALVAAGLRVRRW